MQDQAQPLAQEWALSLLGWGAGVGDVEAIPPSWRPECNRQHNDGEEEGAKNVESQVKRPRGHTDPVGREQPPSGEMLGEPQLHSSPETQAGGYKVWQFGLQVLVSIHHPGQLLASLGLCASAPQGKEATLPASIVCPGHPKGACNMGPLVPEAGGDGVEE